jgi:hypothetical protein
MALRMGSLYESRLAGIESRLQVLTWAVFTLTGLALSNLWLSYSILQRLP